MLLAYNFYFAHTQTGKNALLHFRKSEVSSYRFPSIRVFYTRFSVVLLPLFLSNECPAGPFGRTSVCSSLSNPSPLYRLKNYPLRGPVECLLFVECRLSLDARE